MVSTVAFYNISKKVNIEVFSATIADIQKALASKTYIDPRTKLPKHF